jgi:hypothetical protein
MVRCGTLALRIKTHGDWLRLDQLIALGLSEFKSGWLPDVQEDVVPSRVDAKGKRQGTLWLCRIMRVLRLR